MESTKEIFRNRWLLAAVVLTGLAARLAMAMQGHNYDMNSWYLVADIMRHGGNVYAQTDRYNYGPVWFNILYCLDALAGHRPEVLRYLIAAFLSLVDLGIFFTLGRQAQWFAATLFFLNPVSILITGYHGQFDNLAVLLGLWSVRLFDDDFAKPLSRRGYCGLLLLGFSLMTKHLFFLFPLWLAVKQKGLLQKVLILAVPVACFVLAFAPYWKEGWMGIMLNVYAYRSYNVSFAYHFFLPQCLQFCCGAKTLWLGILVLFAFACRSRNSFESLLIYTGLLVAFSPSTTNQYFAIPIALASVFPSVPFALYTAVATLQICADPCNGPRLWAGWQGRYDDLVIYSLCFALAWFFGRQQFLRLFHWALAEIRRQVDLLS